MTNLQVKKYLGLLLLGSWGCGEQFTLDEPTIQTRDQLVRNSANDLSTANPGDAQAVRDDESSKPGASPTEGEQASSADALGSAGGSEQTATKSDVLVDVVQPAKVEVPSTALVINAELLAARCLSPGVLTSIHSISFSESQTTCSWGTSGASNNGNIEPLDHRIGARSRQNQKLNLPANAYLCELSIVPQTGGQMMSYDDEIFLTFNDYILAASQSYDSFFQKDNGLLIYDWSKIVGKPYGRGDFNQYCAGSASGASSCFIPATQTPGMMTVDIGKSVIQQIVLSSGAQTVPVKANSPAVSNKFEFSFIAIGDDDANDCKHSKFDFDLTAKYVVFD